MTQDTNDRDHQIDSIIKYFDWERVHMAMKALKWYWIGSSGVPTIGDLVITARDLLLEAWDKHNTIQTGGFVASYDAGFLYLSFTIEHQSGETPC